MWGISEKRHPGAPSTQTTSHLPTHPVLNKIQYILIGDNDSNTNYIKNAEKVEGPISLCFFLCMHVCFFNIVQQFIIHGMSCLLQRSCAFPRSF